MSEIILPLAVLWLLIILVVCAFIRGAKIGSQVWETDEE